MGIASRIEAIEADITTLAVDAIVNAANAALMPGGGVDGAIRRKAGREIDEDLYAIGHCNEGEAVITRGYRLPASRVIHTVAPIWAGVEDQNPILARCYEAALALADTHQLRSIAFPSIGTGAYGWPPDVAAKTRLRCGDRAFESLRDPDPNHFLLLFPRRLRALCGADCGSRRVSEFSPKSGVDPSKRKRPPAGSGEFRQGDRHRSTRSPQGEDRSSSTSGGRGGRDRRPESSPRM